MVRDLASRASWRRRTDTARESRLSWSRHRSCEPLATNAGRGTRSRLPHGERSIFNSNPTLQLSQHELAYHVHARVAVIEAGNEGKLLTAVVLEDLGVFLRDFLQSLQAIGGETRRQHADPAHALLAQPLHGLVGIGLQPLVETEARLEGQKQLVVVEPHALAQQLGGHRAVLL